MSSTLRKIAFPDGSLDAFARLRVSEPHTIFDSKLITNKQPLFWDELTNGTGSSTHNTNEASVTMTVSANADYVIRQTFMRFNYQPGKGQEILMTGILGEPVANATSKIGDFNTSILAPYTADADGIYWGSDGTDNFVAISKFGTENKVTQANWNIDPMDGTGPSGVAINYDRVQIFGIAFEWLGVGTVTMFHFIDGMTVPVHNFHHANVLNQTTVYMATPNHSLRYEVRSTGGTMSIKHICSTVISEGGIEPSGVTRAVDNGITPVNCGNVLEGVLYIRLNSANPCTTISPTSISVLNTSTATNNFYWCLIRNPTIAGTAPTYTNLANSAIDYAPGAGNNTLTNGQVLFCGYASGSSPEITIPVHLVLNPGIAISGTQDVFAIAVRMFTGTDDFVAAMNVLEITCG